jgi:hypothetical protein
LAWEFRLDLLGLRIAQMIRDWGNGMTKYVRLYPRHDVDGDLFLQDDPSTGKSVLRPELAEIACSKCGKFDELKALRAGQYNSVRVRVKQDFVACESLNLVSLRLKQFLDQIVGSAVSYFETLANPEFYIAHPIHVFLPDAASGWYEVSRKCPACGRFREVVWGYTPVTLTSDIAIGEFHLENWRGISPVWVVSEEISIALTKATPKFKGFVLDPLENVKRKL